MDDVDRVGEAVTHLLITRGRGAGAQDLVEAVGLALGADACVATLAGRQVVWARAGWSAPVGRSVTWVHSTTHAAEGVTVSVTPRVALSTATALDALGAALGPFAAEIGADRSQRDAERSARIVADERWRAAAEMEYERRRLERDLHDGAQHQLVALRMAMALAEHAESTGDAEDYREGLLQRLDDTQSLLVSTARGVLPPALARHGLGGALRELEGADVDVSVAIDRHPPAVESALYFIAMEAIGNARKHAPGARLTVRGFQSASDVTVVVSDDGPGFTTTDPQGGLVNLVRRAATVGGSVTVRSHPGVGTTVTGSVPLGRDTSPERSVQRTEV